MDTRALALFEDLDVPLVPYYVNGKNTSMMFNSILGPPVDSSEFDPYKFSVTNGGMVPDEYEAVLFSYTSGALIFEVRFVATGVQKILEQASAPYLQLLREDFEQGFQKLMEVDDYSIREYLRVYM